MAGGVGWRGAVALLVVGGLGAAGAAAQGVLERVAAARNALALEEMEGAVPDLEVWVLRHRLLLRGARERLEQDGEIRGLAKPLLQRVDRVVEHLGDRLEPERLASRLADPEGVPEVLGALHVWLAEIGAGYLDPRAGGGLAAPPAGHLDRILAEAIEGVPNPRARVYRDLLEGLDSTGYLKLRYGIGLAELEGGALPDAGGPGQWLQAVALRLEAQPEVRDFATFEDGAWALQESLDPEQLADFTDDGVALALQASKGVGQGEWARFLDARRSGEDGATVRRLEAEMVAAAGVLGGTMMSEDSFLPDQLETEGLQATKGADLRQRAPARMVRRRSRAAEAALEDLTLGEGPPPGAPGSKDLHDTNEYVRPALGGGAGPAGGMNGWSGATPEPQSLPRTTADPALGAAPLVAAPLVPGAQPPRASGSSGGAPVGPKGPDIGDPEARPHPTVVAVVPGPVPGHGDVVVEGGTPGESRPAVVPPVPVTEPAVAPGPGPGLVPVPGHEAGAPTWVWGLLVAACLVLALGAHSLRQANLARREVEELRRVVSQPGAPPAPAEEADGPARTKVSRPGQGQGQGAAGRRTRVSQPGRVEPSLGAGLVGSDPGHSTLAPGGARALPVVSEGSGLPAWLTATLDVVLGERFTQRRVLGAGGMGTVVVAFDVRLERRVAIKVPPPHLAGEEDFRKRFLREARALARVEHPNIPKVHDIPEVPDGELPVMIMEFLEGQDLQAYLDGQGVPPPRLALQWLLQAGRGLQRAHELGVLHRDVKPANLMLCGDALANPGAIKVLDFGLAAMEQKEALTRSGILMGSLPYMPPEQLRGDKVGREADVYALAVTGYQLLTGTLPFDPKDSLRLHPPPMSRAGGPTLAPLDGVFLRGLSPTPEARFASVQAFLLELDQAVRLAAGAAAES